MAGLEFATAVEKEVAEAEGVEKTTPLTFEPGHDDERVILIHEPNEGQFAMLMATLGRGSTDADAIAGTINFFVGLLDKNDKAYIEARLMDRDDPFSKVGATRIQEFLENLAEVWSGNPTQPLSVSTLSPPSDGPKSTPTTPLLTS